MVHRRQRCHLLAAAVALVVYAGAAAAALAGSWIDPVFLAGVTAVTLLGGSVKAEALAGLAALALAAGQVGRVGQTGEAAVVLPGSAVGARDQPGGAAEPGRGRRVSQVQGQVRLIGAAASLLRGGVVTPLEGVEAAPAFEDSNGVRGEDALYVSSVSMEGSSGYGDFSPNSRFLSRSIRPGPSWGPCKAPSSTPCSLERCKFPSVLMSY